MNPITTSIATAVGTALIMGILAWALGVFNAGSVAIDKEQIRTVLREELTLDSGKTYGKALSEIITIQATTLTTVNELVKEVDDLEDAVLALASE